MSLPRVAVRGTIDPMDRRSFLRSAIAAAAASVFPSSTPADAFVPGSLYPTDRSPFADSDLPRRAAPATGLVLLRWAFDEHGRIVLHVDNRTDDDATVLVAGVPIERQLELGWPSARLHVSVLHDALPEAFESDVQIEWGSFRA